MTPGSLFDEPPTPAALPTAPLADRMRPTNFDELVGQDDLLGLDRDGGIIQHQIGPQFGNDDIIGTDEAE